MSLTREAYTVGQLAHDVGWDYDRLKKILPLCSNGHVRAAAALGFEGKPFDHHAITRRALSGRH